MLKSALPYSNKLWQLKLANLAVKKLCLTFCIYIVWIFNSVGFKFLWILCYPQKCKHDDITAQGIKFSVDPQKYKPTNSLCLGYPQNFKPSKLNTLTVFNPLSAKHILGINLLRFLPRHTVQRNLLMENIDGFDAKLVIRQIFYLSISLSSIANIHCHQISNLSIFFLINKLHYAKF